jgi:hypothetical protein
MLKVSHHIPATQIVAARIQLAVHLTQIQETDVADTIRIIT